MTTKAKYAYDTIKQFEIQDRLSYSYPSVTSILRV